MPDEFDGDLSGAVFWGADLRGARFRDVNLTDATISHAWLVDVEIDAFIDRVVVNGVDVTAFVNERDRWYPLRAVLGAADPESMRAGWTALQEAWAATIDRARRLPDEDLHASVDGEWSFVQTLRHLLFATDIWVSRAILGDPTPWHRLSLPFDEMEPDPDVPWDLEARPALDEVVALRAERRATVRRVIEGLTAETLAGATTPVEGPGYPPADAYPVAGCLGTVLTEEWQHRLYAERDLDVLEGR